MKRGKLDKAKFTDTTFSFNNKKKMLTAEEFMKNIPIHDPITDKTEGVEKDNAKDFLYVKEVLKYCDEHPQDTGTALHSPIFLCIVFESLEQKDKLLKDADLFRIGNKYIEAKYFADAFNINLDKGVIEKPKKKAKQAEYSFNFGNTGFDFGELKKKKEISETLKGIRTKEKALAEYMTWVIETEYWLCLCFETEKHKTNFLKALGLELEWGKYLWCHDVAKVLHWELEECTFKDRAFSGKTDPKLCSLVVEELPKI